jgi:pimeloyl-ACP methyl ester carboxylesterase
MAFINVGKENSANISLYYEDHGDGDPVVLIHGWPLSSASWEKQVPVLLDAGYRVIAYDRRGFGYSSRPAAGYNYDVMAEDLHRVIDKLNLRDAALVGFSMGGGEVARYLGKYGSGRISKAVFMSAIPPFLLKTSDNAEGIDGSVFEGIKQAIVADRPAYLTQFFNNFYNADMLKDNLVSEEVLQLSWYTGAMSSAIGCLDCVTAWGEDFRDDLRHIDIPVLVVHGEMDRIVPIESSGRRMSGFVQDCRYREISGAPHGMNWTHAAEVNRELMDFLGQGKGAGRGQMARAGQGL